MKQHYIFIWIPIAVLIFFNIPLITQEQKCPKSLTYISSEHDISENTTEEMHFLQKSAGWLRLIKKQSQSTLLGLLLGGISGSITAITNPPFDRDHYSGCNLVLFTVLQSFMLMTIAQDAKKYKLDLDIRTSFLASLIGSSTAYSICTQ